MAERFPAIFVSHGAPLLAIQPGPAREFLSGLGKTLGKPEAILTVSAHWESGDAVVGAPARPETIHDFYGFPDELYRIKYPAPGAPELAVRVRSLLGENGIDARVQPTRGLDHGAWVPLMLMYPDADVPVTQLAVQTALGPVHHLKLGEALRGLRDEGVLILGSGGATHNLREFGRHPEGAAPPQWVTGFQEWLAQTIESGKSNELLRYRSLAPDAARNHPTEEHFLPLFVPAGAGSPGVAGKRIHRSHTFGILAMDAYRFD
ncbi:MAG TPA: class III extradiol ring-cleavage dioxygenase [Burkholderiales bacterium]|jgi:4,5-DOPA dioxygenase extradiol|nr:class III extradiol ring-cleavage dioxygenase [Burkholderiales bacterium]